MAVAVAAGFPGAAQASFPGVNGKIAYATHDGNDLEIFVMDADGQNPTALTTNDRDDAFTRWSANGRKIAFAQAPVGTGAWDIFKMNADGTNQKQLTFGFAQDRDVSWSPDGRIAFASDRKGSMDIFTMAGDGSNPTRLTRRTDPETDPAWSPNGKKIAFTRERGGANPGRDIYVMKADGSEVRRLTDNPTNVQSINNDAQPSWSPDGRKIAFWSGRDDGGDGVFDDDEIYVMDANGENRTQITSNTFDDYGPAWSPDGLRIVFARYSPDSEIWTMDAAGGNETQLTNNTVTDTSPDWQPL